MSSLLKDDTRYVKLWLLLVKGGVYVVKKHTQRILDNDNTTIDVCLEQHRDKLSKVQNIYPKLWELLCSKSKDINVLDISAHAYVLLNLFDNRLTAVEKNVLTELRDKRNELGHRGYMPLPEEEFLGKWSQLTEVLHRLSYGLSSNDRDYVDKVIGDISAIKDLDFAFDELKPFGNQDDNVKNVLAEVQHRFDELFQSCSLEEIKRNPESGLLDITAKITRSSSTQTVFDAAHHQLLEAAKRCISGGNVNQEEDEVFTAFNIMSTDMSKDGASIKKVEEGSPLTALVYNVGQLSSTDEKIIARITVSSSTQTACGAAHHKLLEAAKRCLTGGNVNQEEDEVFTACNNMFNDMSKDGASIKKVEEGSVWITISCSTLTSLKSAFLYLTKTVYNRRLQELGKALNQSVGCCVKLNVNISLESLISTLDKNVKMLVLSCLSIEVGTVVLRKVFDHIVGPDFNEYLDNYPDRKLIVYKLLLSTTVQLLLQHRNDNTPSSDRLYITDLTKLLRYVCGLCPSDDQVWVNPEPTDNRVEANITRLAKCNSIILKEGIEFENETQLTAKCNELCKILEGLSSFCGFNGLQEEINEVMLRIIDQLQQTEENIEREKEREIDELNLETGDLK